MVNLEGTKRLAEQAVQAGVKRFVFVSTVKVHGEEAATPYFEESPLAPEDPYAVSKAEAESTLRDLAQRTGLDVVIVRPPLMYGPGVKANFRNLMKMVEYNLPLPLASVHNRRSLLFVGNLADALFRCAIDPIAAGKSYLVSDGVDLSTPELVRQIAGAMGRPARLFRFPVGLMGFPAKISGMSGIFQRLSGSLQIDSSRIRRELDWTPPYTLEQGLEKTVAYANTVPRAREAILREPVSIGGHIFPQAGYKLFRG
jgi:nucleoside-diphosphate-sugar epimerase